ncbi:hypothetical protein WICMUC_000397 [Wickerhamomyces mucosus]|uniref:Uncharacterized protein n=1 Tax=Wickerhamomyces mucosus TaxID=1378264 RepID=A0A9P8TIX6_9ASCO|nr:hypothetical protein WICMUC_000397 [Wickerhamomyces mucosus]
MSNFIDKLSNKIQGKDHKHDSSSHDDSSNYDQGDYQQGQRLGQQQRSKDSYNITSDSNDRSDDSFGNISSGQRGFSGNTDDSQGLQGSTNYDSQNWSSSGSQGLSRDDSLGDAQQQQYGTGSGRQTRSQASQGLGTSDYSSNQASDQDYQTQYEKQSHGTRQQAFNQGVEEGKKYVNRNL